MKRVCAYCGKKILGYPHVTVWDEQPKNSEGIRFHTIEEAVLYFIEKLGWSILTKIPKCRGFHKDFCDLTYNENDLVCITCENMTKEKSKGEMKNGAEKTV